MIQQLKLTLAILKNAFVNPNKHTILTWDGHNWKEEHYSSDELKNCPACNGAGVVKK